MTKKQLTEKWQAERAEAAGAASKLNVAFTNLTHKMSLKGLTVARRTELAAQRNNVRNNLQKLAARVVTIDQFLKDI